MVARAAVVNLLCLALFNIWCSKPFAPPLVLPVSAAAGSPPLDPAECPLTHLPPLVPSPPIGPSTSSPSAPPPADSIMSSSSAPSFSLSVSLRNSPRLHLTAWLKAVLAYARTLEPTLDQYGALYLVAPTLTWSHMSKNLITAETDDEHAPPVTTIRPRPLHPQPPKPSARDSESTRAFNKLLRENWNAQVRAEQALVTVLLESIGIDQRLFLEESGDDLLDLSPRQIVSAMMAEHGQLDANDLREKRLGFGTKLNKLDMFVQHSNSFRILLKELEGFPLPDIDNYSNFVASLSLFPQFAPYQVMYDIAHPATDSKTFESYCQWMKPHLQNIRS